MNQKGPYPAGTLVTINSNMNFFKDKVFMIRSYGYSHSIPTALVKEVDSEDDESIYVYVKQIELYDDGTIDFEII